MWLHGSRGDKISPQVVRFHGRRFNGKPFCSGHMKSEGALQHIHVNCYIIYGHNICDAKILVVSSGWRAVSRFLWVPPSLNLPPSFFFSEKIPRWFVGQPYVYGIQSVLGCKSVWVGYLNSATTIPNKNICSPRAKTFAKIVDFFKMLFPQLYVSYSLIRNDSEKIFKSHLLWSFKAVPQNECIVRTSTNQSESCWKKIEKFKCWNFTIFPRLHGITLEKRSNNTYTLKVQVRFTWSSGRTLDFIPLGPVFENRYIQALQSVNPLIVEDWI